MDDAKLVDRWVQPLARDVRGATLADSAALGAKIDEARRIAARARAARINLLVCLLCAAAFVALSYVHMRTSYRRVYQFFEAREPCAPGRRCSEPACSDPMVAMSADRVAMQLAVPVVGNLLGDPLPKAAAVFVYWAIQSNLVTTVRHLCGPCAIPNDHAATRDDDGYPALMLTVQEACEKTRAAAMGGAASWAAWQANESNPFPGVPLDSDIVKDFCGVGVGERGQLPWSSPDSLVMLWQFGLGGFARLYLGGGGSASPQDLYHYVFGHGADRCAASKAAVSATQAAIQGGMAGAGAGAVIGAFGQRAGILSELKPITERLPGALAEFTSLGSIANAAVVVGGAIAGGVLTSRAQSKVLACSS